MRVGFVGVGNLGAPMAHMIAHEGWPLSLYARRPEQLGIFRGTGAVNVASLRELGEASDLVCIMVMGDKDVEEVVLGDNILAGMKPGGVIAINSTVHPNTCRKLAAIAAEKDVVVLDAPVAGGGHIQTLVLSMGLPLNDRPNTAPGRSVAPGLLAVMVGGDERGYERALPVFKSFGRVVRHMGDIGAGQTTKLVNNLLVYANLAVAAEAIALGRAMGIDAEALTQILCTGTANSTSLQSYAPDFELWTFPNDIHGTMTKDLSLAFGIVQAAGADPGELGKTARRAIPLALPPDQRVLSA